MTPSKPLTPFSRRSLLICANGIVALALPAFGAPLGSEPQRHAPGHGANFVHNLLDSSFRPVSSGLNKTAVELKGLQKPIGTLSNDVQGLREPLIELREPLLELNTLKKPLGELSQPLENLQRPIGDLKEPIGGLGRNVGGLSGDMRGLDAAVSKLAGRVDTLGRPLSTLEKPLKQLSTPLDRLASPLINLREPLTNLSSPIAELRNEVRGLRTEAAALAQSLSSAGKSLTWAILGSAALIAASITFQRTSGLSNSRGLPSDQQRFSRSAHSQNAEALPYVGSGNRDQGQA